MSTVNNGPQIVRSGLILDLDASSVPSYSAISVYKVECYSTFGGGLRSANYTVQYSDDNSTWTTAFTGVMSNNSSCGIITGTNRNDSNYSKHRYWRYVEGGAVVGHHPRVSRIDFITKSGAVYNLITYTTDNCADSGTYIVGTANKDFGGTTWRDISGNNRTGTLTNGPLFNTSNYGSIAFDGTNDYVSITNFLGHQTNTGTIISWAYPSIITSGDRYLVGAGGSLTVGATRAIRIYNGYWSTVSYGSSNEDYNSIAAATLNTWQHVAFVWNLTTVNFYLNGTLYSVTRSGMITPSSTTFSVGCPPWSPLGSNSWNGRIANVHLYNRALSTSEISQNYEATKTRFGL